MASRPHLLDALRDRVLLCDGGMGSRVQALTLDIIKDFWDKENCTEVLSLSRPELIREIHRGYYEAGADMVFPTMLPPPLLAQVRARLTRPVMVVDSPGYKLADEAAAGAAIVLYFGFSLLVQYQAVQQALDAFRQSGDAGAVPGLRENVAEFEKFIGYAGFTERTRKYGAG